MQAGHYAIIKVKRFRDSVMQEVLFDGRLVEAVALTEARERSTDEDAISVSIFRGKGTLGHLVATYRQGRREE